MADPVPTNNFDGLVPKVGTFTILSPALGATTVNVYGCEDVKPPDREVKKDTFTVISGTRAGKEQNLLCSYKVGTMEAKLAFNVENLRSLDALVGVNGCTIVLTIDATTTAPGVTFSCTGGIEKLGVDRMMDSQHAVANVTLAVDAGWTIASVAVA